MSVIITFKDAMGNVSGEHKFSPDTSIRDIKKFISKHYGGGRKVRVLYKAKPIEGTLSENGIHGSANFYWIWSLGSTSVSLSNSSHKARGLRSKKNRKTNIYLKSLR